MRRQYKFLGGILAIIFSVSIVAAQNLSTLMDSLGADTSFGYTTDKKISVKGIANNIVTLESPLVKDGSGTTISSYTVMYSQYQLTDILERTDLLSQTKEVTILFTGTSSPFTMDITIDGVDSSKKYYFFVIPKDTKSAFGQISNEVRVDFPSNTYGEAGATQDTTHAAASTVDMSLAHISHTQNGNTITLTWTAIEGSKTIDIDVMKPGTNEYTKAANVSMNSEKYSYTVDKDGEYVFRFLAIDCGAQTTYTATVSGIKTAVEPTPEKGVITKVPKTGPAENVLIVVLLSLLGYFVYNRLYKKSK